MSTTRQEIPPSDPTKGSFGPYSLEDDFNLTNGVYEMKEPVTTTDGNKHIYVVANANITTAPGNNLGTFGTETALLERRYDVHKGRAGSENGLINYNTATPPVLTHIVFAGSTTEELKAASTGETNEVTIEIERTVSRVIATCDATNGFTGEWTTGNNYTLKVVNFLVKQDAYKGVVGQNYYTGTNPLRKKH